MCRREGGERRRRVISIGGRGGGDVSAGRGGGRMRLVVCIDGKRERERRGLVAVTVYASSGAEQFWFIYSASSGS